MTRIKLINTISLFIVLILSFSCSNTTEKKTKSKNADIIEEITVPKAVDIFKYGFNVKYFDIIEGKIKKHETLGKLLFSHNVSGTTVHNIALKSKEVYDVKNFRRNNKYTLFCAKDSLKTAEIMVYQRNAIDYVVFDLRDSLSVYKVSKEVDIRERVVSGLIKSSLSEALDSKGIDYRVSNKMSEIYAWTIDFFRLQKGDYFKLIFDEKYIDDTTYVGIGSIKAAEFYNNGETFYSFYYDGGKFPEYYDETGKNLRKAFLKAPLKFGTFRVSSSYGKRFHPVQHRWKAHLGTDYAAPTGTPIIATANGTISKSGYTRGNGNYVKVRHNSTYSTQYLHMSKRAVRVGQTVKQGQVIGYVGMTGLATGPHVCYRFWKHGKQVNSQKQKLPDAKSINKDLKEDYMSKMKPIKERLDKIDIPIQFEAEKIKEGEVVKSIK